MQRAVVERVTPQGVVLRMLDHTGRRVFSHNALHQRVPPNRVVVVAQMRGEFYIVGRPR